jgi:hypothetical protein
MENFGETAVEECLFIPFLDSSMRRDERFFSLFTATEIRNILS